jgi:hypothetical protein
MSVYRPVQSSVAGGEAAPAQWAGSTGTNPALPPVPVAVCRGGDQIRPVAAAGGGEQQAGGQQQPVHSK